MNNYIIYMHKNKINGKIYIGQTCQKLKTRCGKDGIGYKSCPYFYNAIKEYGWNNFDHTILKDNLTLEEANYWEEYYITFYHTWIKDPQCWGYNLQKGGSYKNKEFKKQASINKQSKEYKDKISKISKKKWQDINFREKRQKTLEEARKQHFKETGNKSWITEEGKKKISEAFKIHFEEKYFLNEYPNKVIKPIKCIETGETFSSAEEAAKWCGLSSGTHISACAKGKRKSAGKHPDTGAPLHWENLNERKEQIKMQLFQMTEWVSPTGKWHCACVSNLKENSSAWYLPARILGISPAEYLLFVIENYKPDDISVLNKDSNDLIILFSWNEQKNMRKFKNYINKKAREVNFQI